MVLHKSNFGYNKIIYDMSIPLLATVHTTASMTYQVFLPCLCAHKHGSFIFLAPHAQRPSAANVKACLAMCVSITTSRRKITVGRMAELNAAAESVLSYSVHVADAYCTAVRHIHWDVGREKVAGFPTAAGVIHAMTSHVGSIDVQYKGGAALINLYWEDPDNVRIILELGGLDALYTASDACLQSADVQYRVGYVMNLIASYSSGLKVLRSGRAPEVAARMLTLHPHVWSVTHFAECLLNKLSYEVKV